MASKHRTDFQVKDILKNNRDGSPDRQQARHQNLMRCVQQLQARGYGQRWDIHNLGKKEVSRLVHDWREQGLKHRTIANRMVDIRWLATKVGRQELIPSNKDIGIGLRKSDPNYGTNKAQELDRDKLAQLEEREQLITELRRSFGLRTEEAVKFQHKFAVRGDGQIHLKKSWCKGGRPRSVPIVDEKQRGLLARVGRFQATHGDRSMIPSRLKFNTYYRDYNEAREKAGIPGHGLRHQWAQDRFTEESGGIKPPLADGPSYKGLNSEEQQRWDDAAKVVNQELGHGAGRQDITATYIGARA